MNTLYVVGGYIEDGLGVLMTTPENLAQSPFLLEDDMVILYSMRAESWDDAMQFLHDNNGWEKYRPMTDEDVGTNPSGEQDPWDL